MSFKATLDLDGKTFEILEWSSELEQKMNTKGQPASGVKGGEMEMVLSGSSEGVFASWIIDPISKKDGTITLYRHDQDSKFKEIKFKGAYLINFTESFITPEDSRAEGRVVYLIEKEQRRYDWIMRFHARTSMSYVMFCRISAEIITIDGVEHDNQW